MGQKGLLKVYDVVKDTFVGNIAVKVLDIGEKILKMGSKFIANVGKKLAEKFTK